MKLFSEDYLSKTLTIETIASKLLFFQEQIHLLHWQTMSYAEHKALGDLYEYIQGFRDDVIEKLMGYMDKRPKVFKIEQLTETTSTQIVTQLCNFAYDLYEWAGENKYCDIENLAQELSGQASKVKYLLTLQ